MYYTEGKRKREREYLQGNSSTWVCSTPLLVVVLLLLMLLFQRSTIVLSIPYPLYCRPAFGWLASDCFPAQEPKSQSTKEGTLSSHLFRPLPYGIDGTRCSRKEGGIYMILTGCSRLERERERDLVLLALSLVAPVFSVQGRIAPTVRSAFRTAETTPGVRAFVRVRVVYSAVVGDRKNDTTTANNVSFRSGTPENEKKTRIKENESSIRIMRALFLCHRPQNHPHLSIKIGPVLDSNKKKKKFHQSLSPFLYTKLPWKDWNESIIQSNNRSVASHHTYLPVCRGKHLLPLLPFFFFFFFSPIYGNAHE